MLHFPLSRVLLAVGAAFVLTQAVYAAPSCSPWAGSQVYNAGDYATYGGKTWRASWWTQGEQPGSSQWGAWQERPASECTPGDPSQPGQPGNGVPPEPKPTVGRNVGSYFTQWGIYDRNYKVYNLVQAGGDKQLTFLNYAFGNVYANGQCGMVTKAESGNGDGGDAWADYQRSFAANESVDGKADSWNDPLRGNFNQLRKLKLANPSLKVLISLGGWTWSKNFGTFAATDAGRKAMVSSCIDLYIKGNLPVGESAGGAGAALGVFDGFDIDWEYPGGGGLPTNSVDPNDKQNYTLLMAEFRNQLNALSTQNKRRYYLTAAIGSGVDKIRNTEPANYSSYLDWINVMTYDFHGGWEAKGPTNFQSNLYRDPAAPVTGDQVYYTVNDAVQTLVNAGVPRAKINVGLPFYGRGWTGVAAGPQSNGLYQVATGPAKGTYEQGIEDYRVLVNRSAKQFVSPVAKQLWTYDGNEFWSYDDPATIRGKLDFVRQQQLGGVFSWSLDGDDAQATLLKTSAEVRLDAAAAAKRKAAAAAAAAKAKAKAAQKQ
ncbi:glycosyl hydrolase family 18 protein [Chromobacterium sphagni]|uniref:chitinase n=1 Tax=Chromobacterium sphagni TaxID=1903179 RepID=A0A1S1X290_9NEIS|nr:glycosyl hydrolase family 18 protein [Chromobacterium sphagni]OHX13632.1 chitinase [Chromobacterium sphagni]OHX18009.1 chitinase [Chromobacterium sphagni]